MIATSEIKTYLGISGSAQDALLTAIEEYVSGYVSGYCRRDFAASQKTESHDGGVDTIFLKEFPIVSVDSVVVDGRTLSASEYTLYAEEGYIVGHFPYGRKNVSVTYTAGFGTIPTDLKMLVVSLCGREYRQRQSQGIKSESIGSARIDWDAEISTEQKTILDRYKKYGV